MRARRRKEGLVTHAPPPPPFRRHAARRAPHTRTHNQNKALHMASANGHADIVQLLLEEGAVRFFWFCLCTWLAYEAASPPHAPKTRHAHTTIKN